ncbi:TetR family transcriptional regulator [Spirochaetia bacterium]|nr:TetR family transcriptional regulator [Spirochaetia bacterium]
MAGRTKEHDEQIKKSRAYIVEALLRLMEKVPYTKKAVSDIIKKVGVARPTFYRHYESKDDVIIQFLEHCFAPADSESKDINKGYVYLMSLPFKNFTRSGAILKMILNNEAEYLVYRQYEKWETHVLNLFNDTLAAEENISVRYRLLFQIAGSSHVIYDWIKNNMPIPVENLIEWLRVKGRALVDN